MSIPQLSVILITRNERAHIADCLRSVAFADEWIVLDNASTDGTAALAASLGARVETTVDWPGFGMQKNRALALARGRWVLSIDADERVTPELAREIGDVVSAVAHTTDARADAVAGYELPRLSSFCGQAMRHGDWYPDRVLRLFQRGAGRFSNDQVHEKVLLDGPVGRLAGHLLHDSMPTLDHALDKLNRYTTGRAADQARAGGRGGLVSGLTHGAWAFVRCYLLKAGFLDGRLGFVLALYVAESTYYRYLKLGLMALPQAPIPAPNEPSVPSKIK